MPETATTAMAGPAIGWGQVLLSLLLVIGALLAVLWLLRRVQGGFAGGGNGLRLTGGLSLGGKERVVVLKVGERVLLLGVAPGSVTLLGELDEPPAADAPAPPSVRDLIERWRRRGEAS